MTKQPPWTLHLRERTPQQVVFELRLRADPTVFLLITGRQIPGVEPPETEVTVTAEEQHWQQLKPYWEEFRTEMAAQGMPMQPYNEDPHHE